MTEAGNLALLLEQLNQRLFRIENAIDRVGASHDLFEERMSARVATLELALARQDGGKKALAGLMGAAAAVGGTVATIGMTFIQSFWPRY